MSVIGRVESLWRYPVKSMRGEELGEAYIGFSGVYGDRLYAFRSSEAPTGFPYLTGREQEMMILYRPRFRYPEKAAKPANLTEAENMAPGLNPLPPDPADLFVDIETPSGEVLAVDDPALIRKLTERNRKAPLALLHSNRAMTDCRPVSLFALQTARQLGEEVGVSLDIRRFRANIYADLGSAAGFAEDGFVGRRLRIGSKAVISVLERDPRCKMITLDPDTAEPNPEILRKVARAHGGTAGVYGAVLVEGLVRQNDEIDALD
jgi:MOSC domain-containing protein